MIYNLQDFVVAFGMGCRVTLPGRDECSAVTCAVTDFAVATGAICERGFALIGKDEKKVGTIWTREANPPSTIRIVRRHKSHVNQFVSEGPDRWASCAAPTIERPEAEGFALSTKVGPEDTQFLMYNHHFVVYPQTKVPHKKAEELFLKIEKEKPTLWVGHYCSDGRKLIDMRSDGAAAPFELEKNMVCKDDDKLYCLCCSPRPYDNDSEFRDKTHCFPTEYYWFKCEPIAAKAVAGGAIQIVDGLFPAQFSPYDEFKNKTISEVLDTDQFQIGRFLNNEFKGDLIRSVEMLYGITAGNGANGRRAKFSVGDTVKIKCEGRTGVVKKLGSDTALLLVGSRPLTYRLDDLAPTNTY